MRFALLAWLRCRLPALEWTGALLAPACVSLLLALAAASAPAQRSAAGALRDRHAVLMPQLRRSDFGAPLLLSSSEAGDRVSGQVHAEVEHPFAQVKAALATPSAVCELLLLHLNVRSCRPEAPDTSDVVTLVVGPKRASAVTPVYVMRYHLRTASAMPAYLRVTLQAEQGPLATSDYRIVFEAIPLDARRSFVHLDYAYDTGLVAQLAMAAYLATAGRDKVGFTVVSQDADGHPVYIRGERAALERNALRYYLALLAVCQTSSEPPATQAEARLRTWFALTERYAAQLHELDWAEYRHEKRAYLSRGEPRLR